MCQIRVTPTPHLPFLHLLPVNTPPSKSYYTDSLTVIIIHFLGWAGRVLCEIDIRSKGRHHEMYLPKGVLCVRACVCVFVSFGMRVRVRT